MLPYRTPHYVQTSLIRIGGAQMATAANDVCKIVAVMQGPQIQEEANIYHVKVVSTAFTNDTSFMNDAAAYLEDIYTNILSQISNQVAFIRIDGFNLTQNYPLPTVAWPTLTTGSSGGDPLPPGVCALLVGRTGV